MRFRSLAVLAGACSTLAQATAAAGPENPGKTSAGAPAFANASFEQPSLAGWSKFLLLAPKPVEPAARVCGLLRARPEQRTISAQSASFAFKPSLGGNYWDVPIEVAPAVDPDGTCGLSMAAPDMSSLI